VKKYIFGLLLVLAFGGITASAQSLGIGGSLNHLSNGILVFYSLPLNEKWDVDAGLRIAVNTFSLNQNKQHYSYYQCGYAMHFPEYFGLNFRISRKLISYKFLRLDGMSNLFISRQSLLSRQTDLPTYNIETGVWSLNSDIYYTKASFSGELTVGLRLKVAVSNKISILAASGIGIDLMAYKHEGYSFTTGQKFKSVILDGPFKRAKRGNYEMVGLDGLPMMFLGVTYALK